MKLAILGIGNVGSAIAACYAGLGHSVTVAARDTGSATVQAALQRTPALAVLPVAEAVAAADVVFLATPFGAVEGALASVGPLAGKVLVDCTNPVGAGLSHGLGSQTSGGETVQGLAPLAHVVKAFTIYGFENFESPVYPGYGDLKPAMLIAGNDTDAKATVSQLLAEAGWEPVDTGDISASLHLEHLTLLWIKMARLQGQGAGFVWGKLTR